MKLVEDVPLEPIIKEVEAVLEKHGVMGTIAVASVKRSCFGIYFPEGPIKLSGREDVRLRFDPGDEIFYKAVAGLWDATAKAANSALVLGKMGVSGLLETKKEAG